MFECVRPRVLLCTSPDIHSLTFYSACDCVLIVSYIFVRSWANLSVTLVRWTVAKRPERESDARERRAGTDHLAGQQGDAAAPNRLTVLPCTNMSV